MILKTDLHMHTNFCDGADTPEQMVLSGIEKGLKTIGIVVSSAIVLVFIAVAVKGYLVANGMCC